LALPLPAAPASASRAPQRPVNLNTATVTELMQLPRVGQKTAERIIAFRKQHGGFQRPEELMNVKGIGEKSFAKLRPYLSSTPIPHPAVPKK
jgi:competence protein ComEA